MRYGRDAIRERIARESEISPRITPKRVLGVFSACSRRVLGGEPTAANRGDDETLSSCPSIVSLF